MIGEVTLWWAQVAKGFLIGPSYTSQSVNAACQVTANWYPEHVEVESGKSQLVMYPTPGMDLFTTLSGETSVPGMFSFNGRLFAAGNNLWEIYAAGNVINRGALNPGPFPTSFAANQANQLLVAAGGKLYVFALDTNTLIPVDMTQFKLPVDQVGFSDTYFVAMLRNSNIFQLSALLDGTTWSGLDVNEIEVFPDNIVSMIVTFREVWFLGQKQSAAYQNTGDTNNPFQPIPSAFMEQGCAAQFATVRMDNTGFWLGADERGQGMAWRANGYTPVRISTHAVETAWQNYPTISDAVGYSWQYQGHSFWHIYFPSGNASWVYDAATSMWHEETFWNDLYGRATAHRSMSHCFAFGKHLVGDWATGNIYERNQAFVDDFGNPIRRVRRALHICEEQTWIKHKSLQIDIESGLGPEPPFPGNDLPTAIFLEDSNGILWSIQVDDNGLLTQTKIATGTPQTILLNDIDGQTTWEIEVDTNGILFAQDTQPVGTGFGDDFGFDFGGSSRQTPGIPTSLVMVSLSGQHRFIMQVTGDGIIELVPQGSTGRNPLMFLRWSDDGGHAWTNYYPLECGKAGEYRKRAIRRRLGRARDRVYEISTTDPIPWRVIDGYLQTA
jgi:hypothetical protein